MIVVIEPARPTTAPMPVRSTVSSTTSRAASTSRARRLDLRRPSAGRSAGAARSSARCRRRPSAPPRRRSSRGRARSSRRRGRRRGRGRGCRAPRRSPVAPANENHASSSPATTSGATSRSPNASRTPATKSAALRASRDAEVATKRTRSTPSSRHCAAYSLVTREGALHRLGGDDAGAVDALAEPDDLHPAHDVGERAVGARRRRRGGGSSWCRSRSRPPGEDAGAHASTPLVAPTSPPAGRVGRVGRAGVPLPPRVEQLERLVAERVDPRPGAERVRDEHVQALDARRHPAGRDPGDLRHVTELGAALEVVVVRRGIPLAQRRVGVEAVAHLAHDALALEGRQRTGEARAGGVERRRERRAVGQPRLGAHDVGLAARAAVGDLGDAAGVAARAGGRRRRGRPARRAAAAATLGHRRAPGASAVRVDSQTVAYHGQRRVASSTTAARGPPSSVAGSASSTV